MKSTSQVWQAYGMLELRATVRDTRCLPSRDSELVRVCWTPVWEFWRTHAIINRKTTPGRRLRCMRHLSVTESALSRALGGQGNPREALVHARRGAEFAEKPPQSYVLTWRPERGP